MAMEMRQIKYSCKLMRKTHEMSLWKINNGNNFPLQKGT